MFNSTTNSISNAKQVAPTTKKDKIMKLLNDIDTIGEQLYKGKYKEMNERGNGFVVCSGIGGALVGFFAECCTLNVFGVLGGMATGASIGVGAGFLERKAYRALWGDEKFKKQCEQENPELYKKLQDKEKELDKLRESFKKNPKGY